MTLEPGKRPAARKADKAEAAVLDALKKSAGAEAQFAIAVRDLCLHESISMGRWLFASLLAINAGAAVAVLSMDAQDRLQTWACLFFVIGIVLAMLAGQLTGWLAAAALRPLSRSIAYWSGVALHGRRFGAMEQDYVDAAASLVRKIVWVRAAGYASLLSFIIGCALVGRAVL